jgi:type I site-specific restriction endonuclease
LTEGFDNPAVEVVIMARPTKSRALYAQMAGRSTRPAEAIAHELNDHESAEARRALIEASNKPGCLIVDFVGNAGRHKLCTSVDILGGKVSDRARELAVKRLTEQGGRVDEALEAGARADDEEKKREEAKRARLVARAKWTAQNVNPFDVMDLKPVAERGWDRGKHLTEKQTTILKKQGVDAETMPYGQARQILTELFRRWDGGLCSYGQAKILRKRGLSTDMTRDEAARIIDEIAAREGWKRKEAI